MSKSENFRKSQVVSDEQMQSSSTKELDPIYQEFINLYDEFFRYLQGIEFLDYLDHYKKSEENDTIQCSFTEEQFFNIIFYLELICKKSEYIQLLNEKEIPDRSNDETDYSSLTSEEKENAKIRHQKQLAEEEKNIRIQYYIKDIVHNHLIYHNESIRKFFTFSSGLTLMQFCESDFSYMNPPTIHFRFKSPKELLIKSARNIFIHKSHNPKGSNFVRNSNGKDTFEYRKVNDAYAYKLIGSIGNTPHFAQDSETDQLLSKRKLCYILADRFGPFQKKLTKLIRDTLPEGSSISYEEYFQNCLRILFMQKRITNEKAKQLIEDLNQQITHIRKIRQSYKDTHSLNDPMDSSYFDNISNDTDKIDFRNLFNNFLSQIPCRLTIKIFETELNEFFNQSNTDFESRRYQDVFRKFELMLYNSEDKCTSSGHEAYHYDLKTYFFGDEIGCECQGQDIIQYLIDQYGPFTAHSLMPGKQVELLTLPTEYSASNIENPDDFFCIGSNYYNKQDVHNFIKKIEIITAKKGKISYNKALGVIKIEFYSPLHNYKSIATELPSTSPDFAEIQRHFLKLENKPDSFKNMLFGSTVSGYECTFDSINSFISALRSTPLHKKIQSSTRAASPSQISSLDETETGNR